MVFGNGNYSGDWHLLANKSVSAGTPDLDLWQEGVVTFFAAQIPEK
jgi:hypothetical protein